MNSEQTFVVDRTEGEKVVLIGDDESEVVLPKRDLPAGISEGMVLRVKSDRHRTDWMSARVDHAEKERREIEARAKMERLRKDDPGGDLAL